MAGSASGRGESPDSSRPPWALSVERAAADTIMVRLAGSWRLGDRLPVPTAVEAALDVPPSVRRLVFETREMTAWDTGLLTFVGRVLQQCDQRRVEADRAGLPEGVRRLLDLATAVPERKTGRGEASPPRVTRIGLKTLAVARGATEMLGFVGEALLAFLALLRGRARYRRVDLLLTIEEVGARALPIVTLISFLSGMILAFVGAVQLRTFGAGIYVADLVGIAMAQEMGALMTGIIMAGRAGAAFAAQLGTMRVNEEIDALTTLGISPAEFASPPEGSSLGVGVGPVEIAGYLDRPQIVTRSAREEVRLAEFDQWAEPLRESIARVLAENLAALLQTDRIAIFPWRGSLGIQRQVVVEVLRFDGPVGGEVTLWARWRILEGGKERALRISRVTEPTGARDYGAMVGAMSRSLTALSREIAGELKGPAK